MTRAGTGIEDQARRQVRQLEALEQLTAHLGVQHGGRIEAGGGAIEGSPYAAGVERGPLELHD